MSQAAGIAYGLALCALAGVSGAFAAVAGKIAGLTDIDQTTRIACYVLLLVCNGLMLILYGRSLRYNTSLASTAATTAINISATGWLGRLVFGEATSLQWWIGATTILGGSYLINRSQKQADGEQTVNVPAAAARAAVQQEQQQDGEEGTPAKSGARRATRRTRRALTGNFGAQVLGQQGQNVAYTPQQHDQHSSTQRQQEPDYQQQEPQELYKYAVLLQYDGTQYAGFQLQGAAGTRAGSSTADGPLWRSSGKGGRRSAGPKPTIQLRLEEALRRVTREERQVLKVQAAGRTDAGVHARGQVAEFQCRRPQDPAAILRALNGLMPADIRALAVQAVPLDFNVRYKHSATYTYDLHLAPVADPFLHRWRHHPRRPDRLRLDAMAEAARLFVGTHNFSNFANMSPDGERKSPIKTVLRYELHEIENGARLEVEGTGFLYKQVRHMTGALLTVGAGTLAAEDIAAALEAGGSVLSGAERHAWRGWQVAPAKGLCLQRVLYAPRSELLAGRSGSAVLTGASAAALASGSGCADGGGGGIAVFTAPVPPALVAV